MDKKLVYNPNMQFSDYKNNNFTNQNTQQQQQPQLQPRLQPQPQHQQQPQQQHQQQPQHQQRQQHTSHQPSKSYQGNLDSFTSQSRSSNHLNNHLNNNLNNQSNQISSSQYSQQLPQYPPSQYINTPNDYQFSENMKNQEDDSKKNNIMKIDYFSGKKKLLCFSSIRKIFVITILYIIISHRKITLLLCNNVPYICITNALFYNAFKGFIFGLIVLIIYDLL